MNIALRDIISSTGFFFRNFISIKLANILSSVGKMNSSSWCGNLCVFCNFLNFSTLLAVWQFGEHKSNQ